MVDASGLATKRPHPEDSDSKQVDGRPTVAEAPVKAAPPKMKPLRPSPKPAPEPRKPDKQAG